MLLVCSVQFSHSVVSNSLWHYKPQNTRPPCPSPTPRAYPNSCPLGWWSHALLLPSIFPSIRVFSNELALCIRWPKYWSFSFNISPSNERSGLISFRMDWLDLLNIHNVLPQGTLPVGLNVKPKCLYSGKRLDSVYLWVASRKKKSTHPLPEAGYSRR